MKTLQIFNRYLECSGEDGWVERIAIQIGAVCARQSSVNIFVLILVRLSMSSLTAKKIEEGLKS